MIHHPFNPTSEQRANLECLAAHLDLGVTNLEFDMEQYCKSPKGVSLNPYEWECGTVACAAGHGPSLGIEARPRERWISYAERVFGVATDQDYYWISAGFWARTDNTPRGAAARIRYALRHGIPENYFEQMLGKAPLSYTVPERRELTAASHARA